MLREIVKILSYMDWLRPLLTVAQNQANGPSHTFLIPDDCGWSPKQVESHLRKKGIKTWGLDVYRDQIMLSTTSEQATLVQHLLKQQGIAVENPVDAPSINRGSGRSSPEWRSLPSSQDRQNKSTGGRHPFDRLDDKMDDWHHRLFGD
jgi:hypothetical protein